jgi:hypothetical protein
MLSACGGGGGGGGGTASPGAGAAPNVLAITVDSGPAGVGALNEPYVSVAVCVPGSTTNCQTIDHILVDTGSAGLRIMASALQAALPAQTGTDGNPLAECVMFVDGVSWGAVRLADVQLGGLRTANIPIQIIADTAFPSVPTDCAGQGVPQDTVASFGANGVLGVGAFLQDCGEACVQSAQPMIYYACPNGNCQPVAVPLTRQVGNPVAALPSDNNGVAVALGAVGPTGAASVSGSLILGVGSRANNTPANAVALDMNALGNLVTVYKGAPVGLSFVDSGSNGLFFQDATIPVCGASSRAPGWYCPASTLSLSATLQGVTNGAGVTVPFSVANADSLVAGRASYAAFANLAGPIGGLGFDWGLPFFYGRTVYIAFEQQATPLGKGPLIAF